MIVKASKTSIRNQLCEKFREKLSEKGITLTIFKKLFGYESSGNVTTNRFPTKSKLKKETKKDFKNHTKDMTIENKMLHIHCWLFCILTNLVFIYDFHCMARITPET